MGLLDFMLRGPVLDLAVGIVVGGAFNALVSALVSDFITPFIAAIFREPDFSKLYFTLNESKFTYGHFFNALLSFVIICIVLYYAVVLPSEKFFPKPVTTKKCDQCFENVPIDAKKCKFCTSVFVVPVPGLHIVPNSGAADSVF
jgi:large conductance mechanosensitive channel